MHNGYKQCCFFGYGLFEYNQFFFDSFRSFVNRLIVRKNVGYFNFGSRSDFDDLAHRVVTLEKRRIPRIARVGFPLNNEIPCLASMKEETLRAWNLLDERITEVKDFDYIVNYKEKLPYGPIANRLRNKIMIENSDIVVFCVGTLPAPEYDYIDGPRYQTKKDYDFALKYANFLRKEVIIYTGSE